MNTHLHRRITTVPSAGGAPGVIDVSAKVEFTKDKIAFSKIDLCIHCRDLSSAKGDVFASCSDSQIDTIADALKELADEARRKHAIVKEAL